MDDFIPDFLTDIADAVAALHGDLGRLADAPDDQQLIGRIFRTLHNIKGCSGFLGLPRLGNICHAGETVLGQIRDGALLPSQQVIRSLLRCADRIRDIIDSVELSGGEGGACDDALIAELSILHDKGAPSSASSFGTSSAALQALFDATPGPQSPAPVAIAAFRPARRVRMRTQGHVPANVPRDRATVRLEVGLLEELGAAMSELTSLRNQMLALLSCEDGSPLATPMWRLSAITAELQDIVKKTRLQPISTVWSALPKLVRELESTLGKKIDLVMEGADTEFDREVLESIKDPLIHIIRNAADHGLERPEVRQASGKTENGHIRLSAFLDGLKVVIRVEDDGRGLDAGAIRHRAVESGLASRAQVTAMADAEIFRFILRPGFSTATELTSLSGRGIGMDVARSNVERMGGTIDIASRPGQGTVFIIKIPLNRPSAGRSAIGIHGGGVAALEEIAGF